MQKITRIGPGPVILIPRISKAFSFVSLRLTHRALAPKQAVVHESPADPTYEQSASFVEAGGDSHVLTSFLESRKVYVIVWWHCRVASLTDRISLGQKLQDRSLRSLQVPAQAPPWLCHLDFLRRDADSAKDVQQYSTARAIFESIPPGVPSTLFAEILPTSEP